MLNYVHRLQQSLLRPRRSGRPRRSRPTLEHLEDRSLLSGSPAPVPYGPLPTVTADLTANQVNHADAVINWNATMLRAIWNDATPPTNASRVEAMVGVAGYDAVDGIHPTDDLYPVPGLDSRPHRDASPDAAAIAAADVVLNSLYPDQKAMFDAEYQATLARVPDGKAKWEGVAWGQTVGAAVLAWRSQDGSNKVVNYTPAPPNGPPGQYELTPPAYKPVLSPQWPQVTPWAMTSPDQFLPPGPPALDSAQYAADFNYTKSLGGIDSTTRTQDQTLYAHFWADNPGVSVTPPGHWNEIAENVSLQRGLSLEQNARLFALLNIGLADAAIVCWDAKYTYNFWRPVTAINYPGDSQINPATTSDPGWTPLWNTPNFPEYASGHSTFSGAADAILTSVFGPNTHFTVGSDNMPGYTRSYTSFTQAANEAGESRVVGGIHFETANHDGLRCGRDLGSYIVQNFLLPRGEHEGKHHSHGRGAPGPDDHDGRGGADFNDASPGVVGHLQGPSASSFSFAVPQGDGSFSVPLQVSIGSFMVPSDSRSLTSTQQVVARAPKGVGSLSEVVVDPAAGQLPGDLGGVTK
jgi:hypothetical protein